MKLIYAEQFTADWQDNHNATGRPGSYMSYADVAEADKAARSTGGKVSGSFATNVALNRYRHNKCMFCGAPVGSDHKNCTNGHVNTEPYVR